MPCFLGCLALAFPRFVLVLVWLFGNHYFLSAFHSRLVPLLGFFFLPLTTLVFAFAAHSLSEGGNLSPVGWLLTGLAVLADLGLLGGGGQQWRRSRRR